MNQMLTTELPNTTVSIAGIGHELSSTYNKRIRPANQELILLVNSSHAEHPIHLLGWTQQEAADIRTQLIGFEELWNAPGMEEYDKL